MTLTSVQKIFYQSLRLLFVVCISVTLSLSFAGTFNALHAQPEEVVTPTDDTVQQVLSAMTVPTPTGVVLPTPTASPTPDLPVPTKAPILTLPKSSYSIAVYGDSLEDTMGDNLPYLGNILSVKYPTTHFSFYNYGIGAQNVEMGLDRFDNAFSYKDRTYPPISILRPDIIIIGSFAYNPFEPHDSQKHKVLLSQLVEKAKSLGNHVYILAEVAPLGQDFANAPHGMPDWVADYRLTHAQEIVDGLMNTYVVAKEEGIPLIDVYSHTKTNGSFGSWQFINPDDGIHPSSYGQSVTAQIIAQTIF